MANMFTNAESFPPLFAVSSVVLARVRSAYAFLNKDAFRSPFWFPHRALRTPRRIILLSVVGMSLAFASLALLTRNLWQMYLLFALFSLLGGGRISHWP